MHRPVHYLLAFLGLTTVLAVGFALREYQQLNDSRAAADQAAAALNADWEKRFSDAQKHARELEDQLAALRNRDAAKEKVAASESAGENPDASRRTQRDSRRGGPGNVGENFMAMMDDPQFSELWTTQQRGQLDGRYSDLFKNLKLAPEDLEKFKNLLVEKQNAFRDVIGVARGQGLDPRENRDQVRQLVQQSNQELDANIQSVLGADGFAQYKQYEQTLPQRNFITQLDQRLSYSSTPLNPNQSAQLLQILAQNAPVPGADNAASFRGVTGIGGGRVTITDETLAQAGGILNPSQLSALQQLQAEQQAQQKLYQNIRQQRGANPAAPPGSSPAPAKPPSG